MLFLAWSALRRCAARFERPSRWSMAPSKVFYHLLLTVLFLFAPAGNFQLSLVTLEGGAAAAPASLCSPARCSLLTSHCPQLTTDCLLLATPCSFPCSSKIKASLFPIGLIGSDGDIRSDWV